MPGFPDAAGGLAGEVRVARMRAAFERRAAVALFKRFVFSVFEDRRAYLMGLDTAVAYERRYRRLDGCLLGHGTVMNLTQQAPADALGTVREIVTRMLERFKHADWLVAARERMRVLDATALRSLDTWPR